LSTQFGVSPIAWINDDLPELGRGTPLTSVLADARDLGFSGIELGGSFPRDPVVLKSVLAEYRLALVGGWYGSSLLTRTAQAEILAMQPHLSLLKALGCTVFIIAETSNAIHGDLGRPINDTPRLDAGEWKAFGSNLTRVAEHVHRAGMRFAYHHHLGTVMETQTDLDRFLECTGAAVGLTVDTGHAALGGIDVLSLIDDQPQRIAHVHCKDVRAKVFEQIKSEGKSFLNGVMQGMFTVPGDGILDFAAVMRHLSRIAYDGWVIVEAEQDPSLAAPKRYAETGLKTLRRAAAAANIHVQG
jgi:inosose dehydratase